MPAIIQGDPPGRPYLLLPIARRWRRGDPVGRPMAYAMDNLVFITSKWRRGDPVGRPRATLPIKLEGKKIWVRIRAEAQGYKAKARKGLGSDAD